MSLDYFEETCRRHVLNFLHLNDDCTITFLIAKNETLMKIKRKDRGLRPMPIINFYVVNGS